MLVDGGAPTPAASNPGAWGASVAGVATARGGVGVDANGGLVWAGGRVSPLDLANALIAAGAVRGMQLDINPDWVGFNSYDVGPDNVAHGNGLYGATGANRYLSPDSRDFVAVFIRGTVSTGASAKLGAGALQTQVKVQVGQSSACVSRPRVSAASMPLEHAVVRLVACQSAARARAAAIISGSSAARWIELREDGERRRGCDHATLGDRGEIDRKRSARRRPATR